MARTHTCAMYTLRTLASDSRNLCDIDIVFACWEARASLSEHTGFNWRGRGRRQQTHLAEPCLCHIDADYCSGCGLKFSFKVCKMQMRLHTHVYIQTKVIEKKNNIWVIQSTPEEKGLTRLEQRHYHVCAYTKCVIKAGAFLWCCLCVDCQHDLDTPPPSPLCTWKQETGHTHDFMYRGTHEHTPNWPLSSPPSLSAKPVDVCCRVFTAAADFYDLKWSLDDFGV